MDRTLRRLIAFSCDGATLAGTVDEAAGAAGLLIVAGGNEVRGGAHRGMAMLAARIAAAGYPVFRFDRRGVGDSEGENGGWAASAPDIAAAAAAFRRAQPQLTRLVGLGNCDGATALALFGQEAGVAHAVLTNPWLEDRVDDLPPAAAIRARYAGRLRDPRQWRRLLTGGISLPGLLRGLARIVRSPSRPSSPLVDRVRRAVLAPDRRLQVILARGDATAQTFDAALGQTGVRVTRLPTASHSFQYAADAAALEAVVLAHLRLQKPHA